MTMGRVLRPRSRQRRRPRRRRRSRSRSGLPCETPRVRQTRARSPPSRGPDEPDILDLTEAMEAPARQASAPSSRRRTSCSTNPRRRSLPPQWKSHQPEEAFAEPEPAAAVFRRTAAGIDDRYCAPPVRTRHGRRQVTAVRDTTSAVDSAFNSLAQTVLVQNSRTLDDLVREMLRPMLKAWLDDNLPNMVERMVRAEIERVSRGRGWPQTDACAPFQRHAKSSTRPPAPLPRRSRKIGAAP